MNQQESRHRQDIQILRGLAVLSVLFFHAKQTLFPLGYLGVDSFFVISGFVVTPLIIQIFSDQKLSHGFLVFFKSRFFRLAPALSVMLVLSSFLIFMLGSPTDHAKFAKQGIATLLINGNLGAHLFAENYFVPNQNPLTHTWSLSVEQHIYILLPLLFLSLLALRLNIKNNWGRVYLAITCLGGILFLFPQLANPFFDSINLQILSEMPYYSTVNRVWQFTIGGYFYLISQGKNTKIEKKSKLFNYIVFMLLVVILFGSFSASSKLTSILVTLTTCLALKYGSSHFLPGAIGHTLAWIGDRSYSIYLYHLPIIYIAKVSDVFSLGIERSRTIQTIVAVLLSVLLGSVSYSKIEMKFKAVGKQELHLREITKSAVGTFLIPMLVLAGMVVGSKENYWGLSQNIPQPKGGALASSHCFAEFQDKPCVFGEIGAKTVLLVGDSHAAAIADALVIAGRQESWTTVVWTGPGCGFRAEGDSNPGVDYKCVDRYDKILKWAKANRPKAVVISQYIKGSESFSGYTQAISKIREHSSNVLLIKNNPIFPGGKYEVFNRSLLAQLRSTTTKNVPIQKMEIRDLAASNNLGDWSEKQSIKTYDPTPLFCGMESCSMYSKAGWLYSDNNHLSYTGSKLLIPILREYLFQLSKE